MLVWLEEIKKVELSPLLEAVGPLEEVRCVTHGGTVPAAGYEGVEAGVGVEGETTANSLVSSPETHISVAVGSIFLMPSPEGTLDSVIREMPTTFSQ